MSADSSEQQGQGLEDGALVWYEHREGIYELVMRFKPVEAASDL